MRKHSLAFRRGIAQPCYLLDPWARGRVSDDHTHIFWVLGPGRDTAFFRLHRPKTGVKSLVHYLREYLKKPTEIGAVAPSSDELAKVMLEGLDLQNARAVLEYGPGSGAITDHIRRKISPHTKLAAIEINPTMAGLFRERHPDVFLFEDTVANARMICDYAGIDTVDCIVSGLPWATFSESMQVRFLEEMMRVLRPGGDFVTFAYVHALALPTSKRFANLLHKYFNSVSKSSVVWRNVPPALVYRCRR
jgi:phosphatidylethanolamine/phosphatidyl-N-methylethanolamine N-methyltransferase